MSASWVSILISIAAINISIWNIAWTLRRDRRERDPREGHR